MISSPAGERSIVHNARVHRRVVISLPFSLSRHGPSPRLTDRQSSLRSGTSIIAMNSTKHGAAILALGQAATQASSFARNIILARLISPADFGIAALFAMTLQVVEMLTNVAAETFLVQSEDGNEPELQSTLHFFRAVRGLCSGVAIFLLGGAIASLFGMPQAGWAFRCVGLIPLLRGLSHLDITRFKRELRFTPSVTAEAGSSWLATIAIVPIAFWLRDYRAMLIVLVGQGFIAMVLSHVLAQRKFRLAWDSHYWRRLVLFGWPLTVNGLLMFGIFQGDRIVVGSASQLFSESRFTLTDLGMYSAAFSLAQAPTMMIANAATSLFLPMLSRLQDAADAFRDQYILCHQGVCTAGAITSVFFLTGGKAVVTLLFGARYATGSIVIGLIGVMWALRIVRVAPTVGSLAIGDTKNSMWSNMVRGVGIVAMVIVASRGGELLWVPAMGVLFESLALATNMILFTRKSRVQPMLLLKPIALVCLAVLGGVVVARGIYQSSVWISLGVSLVSVVVTVCGMMLFLCELRVRSAAVLRGLKWTGASSTEG